MTTQTVIPLPTGRPFEFIQFVGLYEQISRLDMSAKIEIDLSAVRFFGPGAMVPLLALVNRLAGQGRDIDVVIPNGDLMTDYFYKAGWEAAIAGGEPPEPFTHTTYSPLLRYSDHTTMSKQMAIVMDIVAKVTEYPAGVLQAVEWSMNEIADNVLNHAGHTDGWLQVITRPEQHRLELAVADCGAGITATIRNAFPDTDNDETALNLAMTKGVTRDKRIGQGNGLAGCIRIAEAANGWVNILSGTAMFRLFDTNERVHNSTSCFQGSVVTMTIPTECEIDVSKALWGSSTATAFEYTHIPANGNGIEFRVRDEAFGFGSRGSGQELSNKLRNIMIDAPDEHVIIDMSGIDVASASFLDEFLAKLIKSIGVGSFFARCHIEGASNLVQQTLDAVIQQRLSTSED